MSKQENALIGYFEFYSFISVRYDSQQYLFNFHKFKSFLSKSNPKTSQLFLNTKDRSQRLFNFCLILFYNLLMIKNIETKSRQKIDKGNQRFLQKKKQTCQIRGTGALELPKNAKLQIEKQHQQQLKPKKIKFITEQFQKSTNFLSPSSNINGKSQSLRVSSQQRASENAYELMKTFKKVKKNEQEHKKSRKQSEQIDRELFSYKLTQMTKIKLRPPNSNSKNHCSTVRDKSKFNRKKGKNHNLPKTSSQSKQSLHYKKKQFLSPEIVKQQDSYYFDSQNQQKYLSNDQKKVEYQHLAVPKRPSVLLFDSNGSVWKQNLGRNILRSTLDLLN